MGAVLRTLAGSAGVFKNESTAFAPVAAAADKTEFVSANTTAELSTFSVNVFGFSTVLGVLRDVDSKRFFAALAITAVHAAIGAFPITGNVSRFFCALRLFWAIFKREALGAYLSLGGCSDADAHREVRFA